MFGAMLGNPVVMPQRISFLSFLSYKWAEKTPLNPSPGKLGTASAQSPVKTGSWVLFRRALPCPACLNQPRGWGRAVEQRTRFSLFAKTHVCEAPGCQAKILTAYRSAGFILCTE